MPGQAIPKAAQTRDLVSARAEGPYDKCSRKKNAVRDAADDPNRADGTAAIEPEIKHVADMIIAS